MALRKNYVDLCWAQHTGEQLGLEYRNYLGNLRVHKKHVKGYMKRAGVTFWLAYKGLDSPPWDYISWSPPCNMFVNPRDGSDANARDKQAMECGRKIHCRSCREKLLLLAACPEAVSATDVFSQVLGQAAKLWA